MMATTYEAYQVQCEGDGNGEVANSCKDQPYDHNSLEFLELHEFWHIMDSNRGAHTTD